MVWPRTVLLLVSLVLLLISPESVIPLFFSFLLFSAFLSVLCPFSFGESSLYALFDQYIVVAVWIQYIFNISLIVERDRCGS